MVKKITSSIIKTIKEEYKFLITLILVTIILNIPLNYYITIGGGISNISKRVEVEDKYESKGSFNLSYVTQLDGNIMTCALSYIIPSWERENADNYKYNIEESTSDIEFRSKIDLKSANSTAIYWAYTLAGKEVKEKTRNLYVIGTSSDYDTSLKVKDEILSIDGNHYDDVMEYVNYIQTKSKDDIIKVKVIRNKKEKEVETKIYEKDGVKLIGVVLHNYIQYDTNPKIKVKFKSRESGPSAGLITTLEIYNQLTKKDITKGLKIAGTGTIQPDGTIGEIGGIEHKVKGAASAKADIFLSPGGDNYKDVVKYAKEKKLKIKIIKVESIEDALEKLEKIKG